MTELAASAGGAAGRGGEVVYKLLAAMEDIAASSKKISNIIGAIHGIPFETNIPALGAAMEAARG